MMRLLFSFLLLFASLAFHPATFNPESFPQDFFSWPVKHRVLLSGTFGELRPNHFHAGVDIKSSEGEVGDSLFAAGPGFISRIRIQESGYGKMLFIEHPNGYTTAYAHMHGFSPEVETYLKDQQYSLKSYEVDLQLPPDRFPLEGGGWIGKMGNTGGSTGPHLHFEIRQTGFDKVFNPLLFGLKVKDTLKPTMHALKVYPLSGGKARVYELKKGGKGYAISGPDTIQVADSAVGFALKTYDHHDNVSNYNGIFEFDMSVDDSLWYRYRLTGFDLNESRYLNAHLDYRDQVSSRSYFNRCYALPGNRLPIYDPNDGRITLEAGQIRHIRMRVADTDGNTREMEFWVEGLPVTTPVKAPEGKYLLKFDQENRVEEDLCHLHFPGGTFYEDIPMTFSAEPNSSSVFLSPVFHLHEHTTPVHGLFEIRIKPSRTVSAADSARAFIGNVTSGTVNWGGVWEDGWMKANVQAFGDYALLVDRTPPGVEAGTFTYDLRGRKTMSFKISDNYTTSRYHKRLKYEAYVDGEWTLFEYDSKTRLIVHRFDGRIEPGKHQIKVVVRDAVGNETILEKPFLR